MSPSLLHSDVLSNSFQLQYERLLDEVPDERDLVVQRIEEVQEHLGRAVQERNVSRDALEQARAAATALAHGSRWMRADYQKVEHRRLSTDLLVLNVTLLESTQGDARSGRDLNRQLEAEVSVMARPWTLSAYPSPQAAQLGIVAQDRDTRIRNRLQL